jgi:hypothetical protein
MKAEMPKGWGSIVLGVRCNKLVDSQFFERWSHLLWTMATELGRPGDGFIIARDRPAHKAANDLVRKFLFKTENDSLLMMDDDADFGIEIVEEMRNFKEGWEYDALQAFYTRRGWPPEAIWFTRDALGNMSQNWIVDEWTTEVASIGTHFLLVRRHVFEKLLAEREPGIAEEDFEWFWYPRHENKSEDNAFSIEVGEKTSFRLGATTGVKVGHITRVTTGWETYHQFLEFSGQKKRLARFLENARLVGEFIDEDEEIVRAKANLGSANVREGLEAYIFAQDEPAEEIGELSAKETRRFYGEKESGYLYELIYWNSTVLYDQVCGVLGDLERKTVLVVGGGIGGEVEALRGKNAVVVFELPGALRDFLLWRYQSIDNVKIYTEPEDLREIMAPPEEMRYDSAVAIDTVEHFHPDDFESTLDRMLELVKEDGYLFFRNNFEQLETYPMHFDHAEEFENWIAKNDLELDAEFGGIGLVVYRRRSTNEDQGS